MKALITGASSGIGLELAKLFARDGHDVVLVARSADKLKQLAAELGTAHSIRATVISFCSAQASRCPMCSASGPTISAPRNRPLVGSA